MPNVGGHCELMIFLQKTSKSLPSLCCQLEPGDLRGPVGGGAGGQRAGAPGEGDQRHPAHQHHARQAQIQVQYSTVQYSTVQYSRTR